MSANIKVVATGVIALCLTLAAVFYLQSVMNPAMQGFGDKFFGFAILLTFTVIVLAVVGVRLKLP